MWHIKIAENVGFLSLRKAEPVPRDTHLFPWGQWHVFCPAKQT